MMCLGVILFGFNLFGILELPGLACLFPLPDWWSFLSLFFSNKFSISWASSSLSGTPMIHILEHWKLSQRFLSLSSFFWIFVSSFCSGWIFISSYYYKLLICVPVSFPSLLVPWIFFFTSLCIAFTSFILQPYWNISVSILITNVLNSASDRLAISLLLSSFYRVLIYSFLWAIFLHLGAPVTLWGAEPSVFARTGQHFSLHCGAVCGGGVREGTVPLTQLLPCFQSLPPISTSELCLSGADFQVGRVLCMFRTLWVSPMNSPVRLGVSPTTTTHIDFYSQRFWGFISPHWNHG